MKLKKITIEGMHNVYRKTYVLNDLTYLHGANGAGKSTVMQAIQLALLGYIPNTNKASKEAIFKHSNGHALSVILDIEDGESNISVTRIWSGTKSSINSTVEIQPEGYDLNAIVKELELPIFNFNEFVGMTANKLKDWFIDFLPSAETTINWKAVLTSDAKNAGLDESYTQEIVNEAHDYIKEHITDDDAVRKVNEYFKSVLSFKKKELERTQSTIQSLIFYDDIDEVLSASEIEEALRSCEALKQSQNRAAIAKQTNEKIQSQLQEYTDCDAESGDTDARYVQASKDFNNFSIKIQESQLAIDKITEEVAQYRNEQAARHDEKSEISGLIKAKQQIIDGGGICPFTSTKCDSIQPVLEKCKQEIDELKVTLGDLDKAEIELSSMIKDALETCDDLTSGIKTFTESKQSANQIMSDIQHRYMMKQSLMNQLLIVPEFENSEEDLDKKIAELKDKQVKLKANAQYNALIDELTAQKFKLDQEIIAYKSWINLTGVNGMQSDASAIKPFIDLQSEMDKYIQTIFGENVSSKFNIEAKANSFSFGIERDNSYILFNLLSSGEKCLYTLALMLSLVHSSKSPLKLVMVDDLLDHLDDTNIQLLFESLESVDDIQMIFAGVKPVNKQYVIEVTNN